MKRKLLVVLAGISLATGILERRALAQMTSAVLGAVAGNPVAVRSSDGSAFFDPREVEGQNNERPIHCNSAAFIDMTTATTTQIVALSASTHIYVCSYAIHVSGATDVKLVSGTGTNCATSQADVSQNYDFAAADAGINRGGGGVVARTNDSADALCVTSSAAVDVSVSVSYAQF